MHKLKSKLWWAAAGTRAVKTMAQVVVASVPTSAVLLTEINWTFIGSAAVVAGILSLCTSLAGLPEVVENDG